MTYDLDMSLWARGVLFVNRLEHDDVNIYPFFFSLTCASYMTIVLTDVTFSFSLTGMEYTDYGLTDVDWYDIYWLWTDWLWNVNTFNSIFSFFLTSSTKVYT